MLHNAISVLTAFGSPRYPYIEAGFALSLSTITSAVPPIPTTSVITRFEILVIASLVAYLSSLQVFWRPNFVSSGRSNLLKPFFHCLCQRVPRSVALTGTITFLCNTSLWCLAWTYWHEQTEALVSYCTHHFTVSFFDYIMFPFFFPSFVATRPRMPSFHQIKP